MTSETSLLSEPKLPHFLRLVAGAVAAPCGFQAAGVRAGIKRRGRDLALVYSAAPATGAGAFTTNRFPAASVLLSKERVALGDLRGVIVNSGSAISCTGIQGYRDAVRMTELAADALGVPARSILVCSTGVIGERLPMGKLPEGVAKAAAALSPAGGDDAARAIMTTDTRPKTTAVEFELDGRPVRVGGMAKGSGMIAPNLATMLAFLTTDAQLSPRALRSCLREAVEKSFNLVAVDGDTSTNDAVLLLANRQAEAGEITPQHGMRRFRAALGYVTMYLARELVRDGEGASRMVEVKVRGALSQQDARVIARTIATSPLVKTALAGGDPNWGRVLAAAGRAGVPLRPELVELYLGRVRVVEGGAACKYRLQEAQKAVSGKAVEITLDLNEGTHEASVLTCDLTAEYVRINSAYHT
jgi:glutamate N-acetyltransferase/amino-acid N-acetyltransferase